MVAIAVTYGLQYIMFYAGALLLVESQFFIAVVFWIGMGSVPKVLNQYGWSSSGSGKLAQATSIATSVAIAM